MVKKSELGRRFEYHPATSDRVENTHEEIRRKCLDLALFLQGCLPECREASVAQTKLQEVMMWANAAVAITQLQPSKPRLSPEMQEILLEEKRVDAIEEVLRKTRRRVDELEKVKEDERA